MSIREALRELEMWGAATTFTLTSYMDTDDKELFIVKDWKELVNQVGLGAKIVNIEPGLRIIFEFIWQGRRTRYSLFGIDRNILCPGYPVNQMH